MIRPATPADFPQILALNSAFVHFLSPMDEARLALLHSQAAYHHVALADGEVAAFLLAFREGANYDSVNYRWFAARYPEFVYIDRIVVSASQQGKGWGALLYDDLFTWARARHIARITCEIDAEPPNAASEHFHKRYGFVEVGTQWVGGGKKRVSLCEAVL